MNLPYELINRFDKKIKIALDLIYIFFYYSILLAWLAYFIN